MGEIDDILNDTVTIEPFLGEDTNGDRTYGTAVTYPAFVSQRIKKVLSMQGEDVVSTVSVMLDGAVVFDRRGRDRITIDPGTAYASQPVILAMEDAKDGDGTRIYWEIST
jgi:hypothetical protein